jgi:hypothetical protein
MQKVGAQRTLSADFPRRPQASVDGLRMFDKNTCEGILNMKQRVNKFRRVVLYLRFLQGFIAMKSLPSILALPLVVFFAISAVAQAPQIAPANPLRGTPAPAASPPAPATQAAPAEATSEPRQRKARRNSSETGEATTGAKREPSASQVALRARQKQCGEQWRADKTAGKVQDGQKWPQYWSACNKRLKAGTRT